MPITGKSFSEKKYLSARGKRMAHIEEGRKVMAMVIETLSEFGKVETEPQQHGRRIICMIAPK